MSTFFNILRKIQKKLESSVMKKINFFGQLKIQVKKTGFKKQQNMII